MQNQGITLNVGFRSPLFKGVRVIGGANGGTQFSVNY